MTVMRVVAMSSTRMFDIDTCRTMALAALASLANWKLSLEFWIQVAIGVATLAYIVFKIWKTCLEIRDHNEEDNRDSR